MDGGFGNQNQGGLYKTSLCRNFEAEGDCRFGDSCRYAHGQGELRERTDQPQFNQQRGFGAPSRGGSRGGFGGGSRGGFGGNGGGNAPCRNFHQQGSCSYGDNCRFSHDLSNSGGQGGQGGQGGHQQGGSAPCKNWQQQGSCSYGDNCRFAHE